ncbi:carbohydrate kinase [Fulvitalea axinellae]|uniref:Carbohydrate kinase n=1 Tax=Fulvitalea axinellae TaxID=1182444 RepID=A0AAU9CMK3_9BACT|nr:carbohydrate kinase [Fulvitalea axinellae]
MGPSVIAIFDIGRTNKKFCLLNRNYEIVHEEIRQFSEIEDEDGFLCEDLEEITKWMRKTLHDWLKSRDYTIRAINFSAYGAGLVHVNKSGKPVAPIYNYWKPLPQHIKDEFFEKYGPKEKFLKETATGDLNMLNSGMQLFWLRNEKPEVFKKVHSSLYLPQYLSAFISGKNFSELTSLGLHSMIWDFSKDRSHDWVYKEKLYNKFPPVISATASEKVRIKNRELKCGIGIQDSLASLYPYQISNERTYVALTSGCWSIAMNPFDESEITEDELSQDVFKALDSSGKAIRTARIFLGREHDYQTKQIAQHFGKDPSYAFEFDLNEKTLERLAQFPNPNRAFYPKNFVGTGPFPSAYEKTVDLSLFSDFEEAYHQLLLDLAYMQKVSLELSFGPKGMDKVFMAGGFSLNEKYTKTLASIIPDIQLFKNNIKWSAVLGAALLLHNQWNKQTEIDNLLNFTEVEPLDIDISGYKSPF